MPYVSRRAFAQQTGLLLAGAHFAPWERLVYAQQHESLADRSRQSNTARTKAACSLKKLQPGKTFMNEW